MRKLLSIEGMSCGHCVLHVKTALTGLAGVTRVDVDLLKKSAMVEGEGLSDVAMKSAVAEAGYSVTNIIGSH